MFEAVIVPHRSLSRRGRRVVLGAIGAMCCATAAAFFWLGAWPVSGFAGMEVPLAILLFHLNVRAARASELVMLSEQGLRIVRTDARGVRRERRLPASWLNVQLDDRPGRVPVLLLVARDVREEIGRSLNEDEKRDLAAALQEALHRWRNPRFDNPQLRD
nr:DUF2244 domain-containing protein [Limobrevibacterium gyesilva]